MNTVRSALVLASIGVLFAGSTATAQKRQRDLITRQEILASPFVEMDIYQVIRGLRPHFFEPPQGQRSVGRGEYAALAVYQDERIQLDVNSLKIITPRTIESVKYLSPSASVSRFGPKINGGALILMTYKGPPTDSTKKP